ncbi:hypothetical protein [Ralstonia pseudosolanacearum]|uniref:hypothetical protein n=1 Tax=Ralstonia pseudosolanacearum TaxID=1310165 RepID=UPI003C79EC44
MYHLLALRQVLRMVVGRAHLIAFYSRELALDDIRAEAHLVEGGRREPTEGVPVMRSR